MRGPVACRDLVRDQLVGRRVVGDAQQRLRQAHQDYAFLRGQVVLAQERVEAGALHACRAHALDQLRSTRRNALAHRIRQTRRVRELAHDLLLVAEIVAVDGGSDGSLGRHDDGSRLVHGRGSLHRSGRRFYAAACAGLISGAKAPSLGLSALVFHASYGGPARDRSRRADSDRRHLHDRRRRSLGPDARARGFLGAVVRPLQAAHADPRSPGHAVRRALQARQGEHRRAAGAGAADRRPQPADGRVVQGPHRRRSLHRRRSGDADPGHARQASAGDRRQPGATRGATESRRRLRGRTHDPSERARTRSREHRPADGSRGAAGARRRSGWRAQGTGSDCRARIRIMPR